MSTLLDESSNNCSERRASFQIQSDNAKVPSESQMSIALESDSSSSAAGSSESNEDDTSLRSGRSSASSSGSSRSRSSILSGDSSSSPTPSSPLAASAVARAIAPSSSSSPRRSAQRRSHRSKKTKKSSSTSGSNIVGTTAVPKKESRWQTMCLKDPDQESASLLIVAPKRCCSPTPASNRRRSLNSILDLQCVIDSVMNETKLPAIEKDKGKASKGNECNKKKIAPCTFDLLQEAIDVCAASPLVAASIKNYEEDEKNTKPKSVPKKEE